MNMGLASNVKARFLLASTSEVWRSRFIPSRKNTGAASIRGIRSCYDDKRIAETLALTHRQNDVDIRLPEFSTYGPRMLENDGRVVSNSRSSLRDIPDRVGMVPKPAVSATFPTWWKGADAANEWRSDWPSYLKSRLHDFRAGWRCAKAGKSQSGDKV